MIITKANTDEHLLAVRTKDFNNVRVITCFRTLSGSEKEHDSRYRNDAKQHSQIFHFLNTSLQLQSQFPLVWQSVLPIEGQLPGVQDKDPI
jgi:hypothetical protein